MLGVRVTQALSLLQDDATMTSLGVDVAFLSASVLLQPPSVSWSAAAAAAAAGAVVVLVTVVVKAAVAGTEDALVTAASV